MQNLEATFARMRAEREREAADEIARGNEAAQRVRALADRTVVETESEANRDANVTRGEADAERNAIFADSYGADPEFFAFYRSLSAYEQALGGDNSRLVMTPDGEFFEYFRAQGGDSPVALPSASNDAQAPGGDEQQAATETDAEEPQAETDAEDQQVSPETDEDESDTGNSAPAVQTPAPAAPATE